MLYAGIGSRSTPSPILAAMRSLAVSLGQAGHILRSGRAIGADSAFEAGALSASAPTEIFTPYSDLPWDALANHASQFHPNWPAVVAKGPYVVRLMARNSAIVLGPHLDRPVSVVHYWHPTGAPGGTGQALRIAAAYGIRCISLATPA